ncbi:hypothetical protein NC651_033754 [Populus alba x Populus x berolinensis]|nr:hypothetical protein NC651_033754 [Populus alba x Populus x berolinensis]
MRVQSIECFLKLVPSNAFEFACDALLCQSPTELQYGRTVRSSFGSSTSANDPSRDYLIPVSFYLVNIKITTTDHYW